MAGRWTTVGTLLRAEGMLGDDVLGVFFRMDFGEANVTMLPKCGMVVVKSLPVESDFGV